jgi:hypothetical protein
MKLITIALVTAGIVGSTNCSIARSQAGIDQGNENPAAQAATTPTPRKAQRPTVVPTVQESSPEAVVADLYKVHEQEFKTSRFRIMSGKDRRLLDKYFDKNLADLIWKDLTTHVGEVGVLDFDPFYNAQDADIKNLKVSPAIVNGDTAESTVTFTNYDKKEKLIYTLVKQDGSWKISNINYGEGNTLLKFFEEGA